MDKTSLYSSSSADESGRRSLALLGVFFRRADSGLERKADVKDGTGN